MSQFDTRSKPADSQTGTVPGTSVPRIEIDPSVFTWGGDGVAGSTGGKAGAGGENVFSRSYGDDAKPAADKAQPATPGKDQPTPDKTAKDLKAGYVNNPRAVRSLEALTGDSAYKSLSDEKKSELLGQFKSAPNDATTNFLKGLAEYEKAKAEDKSGDPAKEAERLAKLQDAKTPDSGTFSVGGQNYTIREGKLVDAKGTDAGTIDNLGNYQMTGDKTASNYYNTLGARVKLQEGEGKAQKTLLDLHAVDPAGQLSGSGMNDTFTSKAFDTLRAVRREGMDMGAAPQGAYRSFEEQDRLFAKGRTAPGKKVTGARGGESWHNYGVAADLAFYNEGGNITWPETGDYARLWTRYGELAKQQGLRWGGDWTGLVDRPHIEYHPGYGDGQSRQLIDAHRRGGNEAAWDMMGIGELPNGAGAPAGPPRPGAPARPTAPARPGQPPRRQ
jgi:peptidoglycan L-alanyl-D-glutamate endopeptidase CwlK